MRYISEKTAMIFIFSATVISIVVMKGWFYLRDKAKKFEVVEHEVMNSQEYISAVQSYNAWNYVDALDYFQAELNRLEVSSMAENPTGYLIKGMIGECYLKLGEDERAGRYIQESREYLEKKGEDNELSAIYLKEGLYYRHMNQFERAVECYEKASGYAGDGEIVQCYLGMAESFAALGNEKEALGCYARAIEEGGRRYDHRNLTDVYYSKGLYFLQKNELDTAKKCLEKGVKNAQIIYGVNDIRVALGYGRLSELYSAKEEYEDAYRYCRKAMDIFSTQDDTSSYEIYIVSLYDSMGCLNNELGDYAAALKLFRKSYHIVRKRMQESEFSEFYERCLSNHIKSLFDEMTDNRGDYEAWFKDHFENDANKNYGCVVYVVSDDGNIQSCLYRKHGKCVL
ncbi:tetratricopeptide repeat protein [Clostridiaceae bacterium]|nr:tetratricopeptide repeat protein [Clostridiaceae bacterium]